jgi:hypothetical protein
VDTFVDFKPERTRFNRSKGAVEHAAKSLPEELLVHVKETTVNIRRILRMRSNFY